MPYRRLPNTDLARIRAMKAAVKKGTNVPPFNLAYSQALYVKIKAFLPAFEKAVEEQRRAHNIQASKNKDYAKAFKKAQMYISHFIQVLNFAIVRGEFPANVRKFYGFSTEEKKVPSLNTEDELIEIGKKLIKGEKERTMNGGTPILSPKISLVNIHFDKFVEAHEYQTRLKDNSGRANMTVASLRMKADQLILDIWNEVEKYFDEMEPAEKRKQATAYGLVYVYRKSERDSTKNFLHHSTRLLVQSN
ncbi:MAG: hypothetical protein P1P88_03995 [Bacteroidales bacterium]|nr:hypothetical protein [Bacteroidales bacterium]